MNFFNSLFDEQEDRKSERFPGDISTGLFRRGFTKLKKWEVCCLLVDGGEKGGIGSGSLWSGRGFKKGLGQRLFAFSSA